MDATEQLRSRLLAQFPDDDIGLLTSTSPAGQSSLLLQPSSARRIALFLRDEPTLRLDYCSNVTGVDWPDREIVEVTKAKVIQPDGTEKLVEQKNKRLQPGFIEVVYHLYSVRLKSGPVIVRIRTADRGAHVDLPSLTPVWRSCEFQEREIFDLFGVIFVDHPDLRRILMWDEFVGYPMRRDYVEPDDYEWEPTPHDDVMVKARKHYPPAVPGASPAARRSEGLTT